MPQLDRADMGMTAAAKQHHHGHEEVAGKNRQGDAAGQTRSLCRGAALEMRILEIRHDHRATGRPRAAGKSLIETEACRLAGCAKLPERPVKPAAEFELHAVCGRNPYLRNPNEGRHPGRHSLGMCPENLLSILAHAAPTLLANSQRNDTT